MYIPVSDEDTNSRGFRTPKGHADILKYEILWGAAEKAQPEEKGASLWQMNSEEASLSSS